jgi:threonylcarbamoyladenosine tRNA methylthiotransferase MtaB
MSGYSGVASQAAAGDGVRHGKPIETAGNPRDVNVFLTALGCRLNEAEIQQWAAGFAARGYRITGRPDTADLVVINTCAVTSEAIGKSRRLIRRSRRRNPQARLVVSGCYASLHPEIECEMAEVDLLVPNADKDRLVEIVADSGDLRLQDVAPANPPGAALVNRSRAFVKVQDGCRHRCTFCIVTMARGTERSRPAADIIDEINALHGRGILECVLTGVHLGGYSDADAASLTALIRRLLAETDIPRLRLGSVEPWDLGADFPALFTDARLMPHLHLPLQSGSDVTLKRMARRCRTRDFAALVETLRTAHADMNITTDIIAGFPGECATEWQRSLAFIRRMAFAHVHVFPFSPRPGTAAAEMTDQVEAVEKRRRVSELLDLAAAMRRAFLARFAGRTLGVLLERVDDLADGGGTAAGYSPNYLPVEVAVTGAAPAMNTIVPLFIRGVSGCGERLLGVRAAARAANPVTDC